MTRDCPSTRRSPAMSSTRGMRRLVALPVRASFVRIAAADRAPGGDAVVQVGRQLRIIARTERTAVALEVRIAAEDPVAALDAQRRRAIVESRAVHVADH